MNSDDNPIAYMCLACCACLIIPSVAYVGISAVDGLLTGLGATILQDEKLNWDFAKGFELGFAGSLIWLPIIATVSCCIAFCSDLKDTKSFKQSTSENPRRWLYSSLGAMLVSSVGTGIFGSIALGDEAPGWLTAVGSAFIGRAMVVLSPVAIACLFVCCAAVCTGAVSCKDNISCPKPKNPLRGNLDRLRNWQRERAQRKAQQRQARADARAQRQREQEQRRAQQATSAPKNIPAIVDIGAATTAASVELSSVAVELPAATNAVTLSEHKPQPGVNENKAEAGHESDGNPEVSIITITEPAKNSDNSSDNDIAEGNPIPPQATPAPAEETNPVTPTEQNNKTEVAPAPAELMSNVVF